MPYWLRLYLPIAVLLGLLLFGYAALERQRASRAVVQELDSRLARAEQLMNGRFDDMVSDLRFLAANPAVRAAASSRSDPHLAAAGALFADLIRQKPRYGRVRLLDEQGNERLRVVARPSGPESAPAELLQSLAGRDVFERTRLLQPGQVFVSRFDLEVEYGQIEVPHKPTLRFATPLPADDGKVTVLMFNVRGEELLQDIGHALEGGGAEGMLLDSEGYWLYHPDPALRWGFQLPSGEGMPRRYPAAWAGLADGSGSVNVDEGLFVYRRVHPFRRIPQLQGATVSSGFWLALRVPPEVLSGGRRAVLLSPLLWILQLLALGGCLAFAGQRERARRADATEQRLRLAGEAEAQRRDHLREQTYQIMLRVQAAQTPEDFGRVVLSELAPLLGVAAGALYRMEGDWLRPLAGYGLPDSLLLRQFKVGEGLVGAAVRDRRQLLVEALPAGYLDLRSGAGRSPPSHLLIVPFWVGDDDFGALEVALDAPLDDAQTQLLKQLIPLLSLHLGNQLHRVGG